MENNQKDKKLKIIWWSNSPLARTGLGRNSKSVLNHLYKTDKYDLVMYCMGIVDGHPEFQKLPYKTIGSIPSDQNQINYINSNPHLRPSVAYGGYMLDSMIKNEKPDVLILSDDFWAGTHTGYFDKPWFNKFNCALHCTIDSEPVLPDALKHRDKIKNYFVWATFAEKLLNTDGFDHVKTITGAIDPTPFHKLNFIEKLELREKFDIPRDAFVVLMTSRNQLRKEFILLMEGYAQFKKQNPEIKNTRLILHTHVPEDQGWDLPRAAKEFGIEEEVLYTYVCHSCNEINVKKYEGQDVDCKFCGGQKSTVTCGVNKGCTEEDLNKVYNLADCYCHPANAAGLELGLIEACYSELPIATCAYSGTTMFTDNNNFCFNIDFSWGRQTGTNFKRAIPYASSMAKFFTRIYKLPIQKRQELGKKARNFALNTFSPEIVGKQWENFLDSLTPTDYDFNFDQVRKNDNHPFNETISDDVEWVADLYKNILLSNPDEDGLKNWIEGLKHGQSRRQIHDFFIGLAKKQNSEAGQDKVNLEDLFDKEDKRKRVILILKESIGDHVILTSLLPSILEKYPENEYCIYVSADQKFWDVHAGNDKIKLIPFFPQLRSELFVIGSGTDKKLCDVIIDLAISTQVSLNYLSNKY